MTPVKIAYVIDFIDYHLGGTEKQLLLLLENLARAKFQPYLCCLKPTEFLTAIDLNVPIYYLNVDSFYSPFTYLNVFKFSRFLRQEGIEIVQTHFRDANLAGVLSSKLASTPIVVSTRRNQGYWHNKFEIVLLNLINPMVTGFLTNSRSIKNYVSKIESVPLDKIQVIYNGIDLERFNSGLNSGREGYTAKLGLNPDDAVIVIIANLRPVKGIETFIKAAGRVAQSFRNAKFVLVGDGPEKERLKFLAASLGIAEKVVFLGTRDDVPSILAVSQMAVLSSHSEGLSNAVIEYMAAGLPVVCTDVGGNSELVENDKNGYLVPAGDDLKMAAAIGKILDEPDAATRMGAYSKKKVQDLFSLETFVRNMERYYERLLSTN